MSFYLISMYIHVIAAVVWTGGMLFLGLVVVPITQALQPPDSGARVVRAADRRFRNITWVCIAALLVTGVMNLDH
jgi:putative copper resistance protein D